MGYTDCSAIGIATILLLGFLATKSNCGTSWPIPICTPSNPAGPEITCKFLCSFNANNTIVEAQRYTEGCCGQGASAMNKNTTTGAGTTKPDWDCYCCPHDEYDCSIEQDFYYFGDCHAAGLCADEEELDFKKMNKTLNMVQQEKQVLLEARNPEKKHS